MSIRKTALAATAAVTLGLSGTALAQDTTAAGDPALTTAGTEDRDDDDFPWGLLGLLGLAGLLGMKRRDDHDHRDHRTTGTGTGTGTTR